MVEIKRKKGETYDAMLKRFLGRVQKSGKSKEVKRRRFHNGGQNRTQRRDSALRRVQMSSKYEYLAKTGQLKEEPRRSGPRH